VLTNVSSARLARAGFGQGQDHPGPDAVFAEPVDPGRFTQFVRDGHVVLAHQEHTERAERLQQDQGVEAVGQAQVLHHDVLRHHVGLPRHRDGADVGQEQDVAAREADLGEAVGRE
jgi:hypothetical protein